MRSLTILTVSYAEAAAKGPKQTAEEVRIILELPIACGRACLVLCGGTVLAAARPPHASKSQTATCGTVRGPQLIPSSRALRSSVDSNKRMLTSPSSENQAAAPQPPQVVHTTADSTSSLVDVDAPSVRTVPSDFLDQDVKTDTQADRLEREAAAIEEQARQKAASAKKKTVAKGKKADSWLTAQFSQLSDNESSALVVGNLLAVVGVSVFLGYKAWGLYERGRLGWQQIGIGAGVLGAVGIVESFFGG
jgi:hypothetical protein